MSTQSTLGPVSGPWASPGVPAPANLKARLNAALDKLSDLYDEYAEDVRRMQISMARIEVLRQTALHTLDVIDGDPDLEDGGDDEPSLGAPLGLPASDYTWSLGSSGMHADGCDLELDPTDAEHSLGWSESASVSGRTAHCYSNDDGEPDADHEPSLCKWGVSDIGQVYDGEDEHDGCEPEEDDDKSDLEPSLSRPEGAQYHMGCDSDREDEHDGREPEEDDDKSDMEPDDGHMMPPPFTTPGMEWFKRPAPASLPTITRLARKAKPNPRPELSPIPGAVTRTADGATVIRLDFRS